MQCKKKSLHGKTLIENLPVIQSAMKQLKGERLLHPEWEPVITYDNKQDFMYGKSDVGSITYNDQNDWKFQVTDSNIVAAAVVLTFTAFPLAVMQADYLDIGHIKTSIAMFLLSVYGVGKTLVSQYVVLPLKSWTGVVGAPDQSVALFTGAGKNLICSSL